MSNYTQEKFINSGEEFDIEELQLLRVKRCIDNKFNNIKNNGTYYGKYAVGDYEEIASMNFKKTLSIRKNQRKLDEIKEYMEDPYNKRVDVVNGDDIQTFYLGARDISDNSNSNVRIISFHSKLGKKLIRVNNSITLGGKSYDVDLIRELSIRKLQLKGFVDIFSSEQDIYISDRADDFLKKIIEGRRARGELRDIVLSIQENQERIVELPFEKNIVVQGCAGSGKSMVLLHRLSELNYKYDNLYSSDILFITPNKYFDMHISGVISEYQLNAVKKQELVELYNEILKNINKDLIINSEIYSDNEVDERILEYVYSDDFINQVSVECDKLKKIIKQIEEKMCDCIRATEGNLKHIELYKGIERFNRIKKEFIETVIKIGKYQKEINKHNKKVDKKKKNEYKEREKLNKLLDSKEGTIGEIVEQKNKISKINEDIENLNNEFKKKNIPIYDSKILEDITNIQSQIKNMTLKKYAKYVLKECIKKYDKKYKLGNKTHKYQLYFTILFAKYFLIQTYTLSYKLVCIDEGQDISYNEYILLKNIFGKETKFNIYGDTNQLLKTNVGINNWGDICGLLDAKQCYLNENYRNSSRITNYCNNRLNMNIKAIGIKGDTVDVITRDDMEETINYNYTNDKRSKIAVIISRKYDKKKFLREFMITYNLRIIDNASKDKVSGISIWYVDEAKGIEFDTVFVYIENMSKNEMYVAFTRAINKLVVVKGVLTKRYLINYVDSNTLINNRYILYKQFKNKKLPLNERMFDMKKRYPPYLNKLIKKYNINNLQKLVDCKLHIIKEELTKKEFEELLAFIKRNVKIDYIKEKI